MCVPGVLSTQRPPLALSLPRTPAPRACFSQDLHGVSHPPSLLPPLPVSSWDPPALGDRGYSSHFKDEEMDTQRLEFLAPSQFDNCELIVYCVPALYPKVNPEQDLVPAPPTRGSLGQDSDCQTHLSAF